MAVLAGASVLALAGAPLYAQATPAMQPAAQEPAQQQAAGQQKPAAGSEMVASAGPAAADETPTPKYRGDGVAAIVNDTVISDFDLRQRVALFLATSGMRPDKNDIKRIRAQVLKQLENERLQLLEAQKHNISVSSSDVDKAINNILKDNNMKLDQLEKTLRGAGVYLSTLREQIATQIAWSKTVQGRFGDQISVSSSDVNAELKRMAASADKPRFDVSEIFLPVDSPEQADKVKQDMEELAQQIHAGAPFPAVARQFSQNPTAAQGGDMGWVSAGQLDPALDKVLVTMKPGTISAPIRGPGGYYLLGVRGRQDPEGTKLPEDTTPKYPPGVLPLARLLLPIGPNPPKELLARANEAANVIRTNIRSCDMLPAMVKKMRGVVYMNLGTMHLNQLSAQMQNALAQTSPGETTKPFHSPAGIELIVRCDEAPVKITTFKMPTRQEVEEKLFEEQMSVLARRYMRDLRRDADIETR